MRSMPHPGGSNREDSDGTGRKWCSSSDEPSSSSCQDYLLWIKAKNEGADSQKKYEYLHHYHSSSQYKVRDLEIRNKYETSGIRACRSGRTAASQQHQVDKWQFHFEIYLI